LTSQREDMHILILLLYFFAIINILTLMYLQETERQINNQNIDNLVESLSTNTTYPILYQMFK